MASDLRPLTSVLRSFRRDAEPDERDARAPRPLRITIVQGAFLPVPPLRGGAVEKMWFRLGQEFAAMGHQVTHFSGLHERLPVREEIGGVEHLRVQGARMPSNGLLLKLRDFAYTRMVIRQLPEADILVSNTFWLPILAPRKGKGAIYVDVQRMPKGQMRLYGRAARLRANTAAVAERILLEAPWAVEKVRVIPNALPFDPPDGIMPQVEKRGVLYAGRIHPEKGVHLLLSAVRIAVQAGSWLPGWRVRVVGPYLKSEGGGGPRYRQQLIDDSNGLPIDWLEPVFDTAELSKIYSESAIFVYPSLAEQGETFGSAVLEAMAWGAVPVGSDLPCFLDLIEHGVNGMVFNHRGASPSQELADCLATVQGDPRIRERMAGRAREVGVTHGPGKIAHEFAADFAGLAAPGNFTFGA